MTAGYVLEESYSCQVGNDVYTDLTKASCMAIKGDSGSSVTHWTSGMRYLSGTVTASVLFNNAWVDGQSYIVYSKVTCTTDSLGCSVYQY